MKATEYKLTQGNSDNWYIRKDKRVIAGFESKDHAEYFLKYLQGELF